MKYCSALNGSINIERDRIHYCCVTKHHMPTIPWNPDEDLPVERIRIVRDALLMAMNEDMSQSVAAYEHYGEGSGGLHPCKGCRFIVEVGDDFQPPSTDQLTDFLHMQAFTYCNAKCIYCNLSYLEGKTPLSRGKDLDKAVYKAVNQLLDMDLVHPNCKVIFSSGEPSLSEVGRTTLSRLLDRNQNTMINTNAIKFCPEIIKALRQGNTLVQISLDSGNRKDYLKIKGVDKFESVVKNITKYQHATLNHNQFWLKYIVFTKTSAREQLDSFIHFCVDYEIRHVSVSADYNEGEAASKNGPCLAQGNAVNEIADSDTLEAFGYLASQLEILGVNVHQEYAHLTSNEQAMAKRAYARSVMQALNHVPADFEEAVEAINTGVEMANLSEGAEPMKKHIAAIINQVENRSKGIALYGAGAHAKWLADMMNDLGTAPKLIIDKCPQNANGFHCPVVELDQINTYAIDTVIIASTAYHLQIYSQLLADSRSKDLHIIDPFLNLL